MIKVALIYNQPIDSIDGASKVVSSFCVHKEILNKNGVDISLFAPEKSLGVSINSERLNIKRIIKNIIFKVDIAGVIRSCFNLFVRSKKAYNIFGKQPTKDYDVLFFHEIETCYHYLKSGKKKPVVLVLHTTGDFFSMDLSYYPLLKYTLYYNIWLKHIRKTILTKVDKIVFNSEMAADNFNSLYPHTRNNLATFVNNGVPDITNITAIPHYPPYRIICVGSVTERKGQRFIVEALKLINPEIRKRIHFVIVGDGNIREELEKKCLEWGVNKYINFCGLQDDVIPFLSQANIFILPSVDEGMPIAILEAMRQGLPVVSTRVGGIPYQLVDGENGIMIEASTKGVLEFLNHIDDYNWSSLGKASRERYLQLFSIDQMMSKYSEILKSVVNS